MAQALMELTNQMILLSRRGQEAAIASQLNQFLPLFEQSLNQISIDKQQALLGLLPKLLQLQEHRDWVGYADVLEYELLPLIHS